MLDTVECDEAGAAVGTTYHHLAVAEGVRVECMEWLTYRVEYIIGDIDYIVDWVEADCLQVICEPFGRGADLDVVEGNAAIAYHAFGVFDADGDCVAPGIVESETVD